MTNDEKINSWGRDLHQILVLSQCLEMFGKAFMNCQFTPPEFKGDMKEVARGCRVIINGYSRIKQTMKKIDKHNKFPVITELLSSDKVYQIAEHIEFVAGFDNVAEITELIIGIVKAETNDTPVHICDTEQGAANNGESGKGGV